VLLGDFAELGVAYTLFFLLGGKRGEKVVYTHGGNVLTASDERVQDFVGERLLLVIGLVAGYVDG